MQPCRNHGRECGGTGPSLVRIASWVEPVRKFRACLEQRALVRQLLGSMAYWVCAYANTQHNVGEDIASNPRRCCIARKNEVRRTSFFRAMQKCEGGLLVLDNVGTPFLRVLDCSENGLHRIPSNMFGDSKKLQTIDLGSNKLEALPPEVFAGLNMLQELYLRSNELNALPRGVFAGLNRLQILELSSNKQTWPEVFAGLDVLEPLKLYSNKLMSLPPDVFAGLDMMHFLELGSSSLNALPPPPLECLRTSTCWCCC